MSRNPIFLFFPFFFLLAVLGSECSQADNPAPATTLPAPSSPQAATEPDAAPSPDGSISESLHEAALLVHQGQPDEAMKKVDLVLQKDPHNFAAYVIRGNIYSRQKNWPQAEADYQTAQQIDSANLTLNFNLALIQMLQKKYAPARAAFVLLQKAADWKDVADYEIFFCDLVGGHEDTASQELNAFNQVGSNASYYFANAAWDLTHQKNEDARGWLTSAGHIYSLQKFSLYSSGLEGMGYLPLPPASPADGATSQNATAPGK